MLIYTLGNKSMLWDLIWDTLSETFDKPDSIDVSACHPLYDMDRLSGDRGNLCYMIEKALENET